MHLIIQAQKAAVGGGGGRVQEAARDGAGPHRRPGGERRPIPSRAAPAPHPHRINPPCAAPFACEVARQEARGGRRQAAAAAAAGPG